MKDIVTMKEKKEVLISEKKVDEAQSSNDVFQEPAVPIQESASDFYYKYYHNSRFDFEIYYPNCQQMGMGVGLLEMSKLI